MNQHVACGALYAGALLALVAAPLAVAAGPAMVAPPQGRTLEISVTAGRLSVRASDARLVDVLEAVGRHAGVRTVLHGDLEGSVTDTFTNLPVDEGVRRLSRWQSVVLIYDPLPGNADGPRLSEVWIIGSSHAQRPAAQTARGTTHSDARADARLPAEWERYARTLIAFRNANPETRREKIESLVRAQGEPAIVAALREVATGDPAPERRRAAIQVLASMGSQAALDAVQATLSDAHPGVRSDALTAIRRSQAPSSERD